MGKRERRELAPENFGPGIKRKLTEAFELPKEVVLNLPLISMVGRQEINIENYKGVVEYSQERIRINTAAGVIKIEGKNLLLKQITTEHITITGGISGIVFLS